ncbi:MAG: hypothetical protein JRJ85_27175 [Deltaproteobacteria bacterium]|nr:hypothetical protein [Deltaproteobacteria bacterium]
MSKALIDPSEEGKEKFATVERDERKELLSNFSDGTAVEFTPEILDKTYDDINGARKHRWLSCFHLSMT